MSLRATGNIYFVINTDIRADNKRVINVLEAEMSIELNLI